MTPSRSSPDFAGESHFDSPITVVVEEADALDVLLELNAAPGVEAKFAEHDRTFDEAKEHPLYSLDFATAAELVVALTSSFTTLATALLAYRTKKLAQAGERENPAASVTIVINGQQVELASADTPAAVAGKVQDCVQKDRRDAS